MGPVRGEHDAHRELPEAEHDELPGGTTAQGRGGQRGHPEALSRREQEQESEKNVGGHGLQAHDAPTPDGGGPEGQPPGEEDGEAAQDAEDQGPVRQGER